MRVSTLAGIAVVAVQIAGLLLPQPIVHHLKQSAPQMLLTVASQGLVVVQTGIPRGCSGTPGQAFAVCIFAMADTELDILNRIRCLIPLTLTSSHDCIVFTPSPTSLNVSFDSSKRSCTLSLTRSVSLLVPSRLTSFESLEMLPVKVNSFVMSSCDNLWNSGSSEYCGSSCRRIVVGCDSKDDN